MANVIPGRAVITFKCLSLMLGKRVAPLPSLYTAMVAHVDTQLSYWQKHLSLIISSVRRMWETIIDGNVIGSTTLRKCLPISSVLVMLYNNNTTYKATSELNVLKQEPFIALGGPTHASMVSCGSSRYIKQV